MMPEELPLFGDETIVPAAPEPEKAPEAAPVAEPAKEPEKAPEPKGETKDASPASERPRDESGRFVPKADDEPMVPLSALMGERERRQKAEAAAKATPQPTPDVWEDPKAFINAQIDERGKELLTRAEETARLQFLTFTENAARSRYTDYDQVRAAFIEEANRNPMVASKLRDAPDPAEFIYQQGKTAMQLKEVGGDLAAYRKRIETEVTQKLEREAAARQQRNANIPTSLNAEPSKGAGVQGSAVWAGPTPDEAIFPER